jgi:hypothetical protein
MATQWRSGMNGLTGLDYTAIKPVFNLLGVSKKSRAEVFEAIRVMEGEALLAWNEAKESRDAC